LGGGQEFTVSACPIAVQLISDLEKNKATVFIYGEANYGDIFSPKDARHIIKFCLLMQNVSGDPKGANLSATMVPCPDKQGGKSSNCTDVNVMSRKDPVKFQ